MHGTMNIMNNCFFPLYAALRNKHFKLEGPFFFSEVEVRLFFSTFAKFRQMSVRTEQHKAPTKRIFMKLDV